MRELWPSKMTCTECMAVLNILYDDGPGKPFSFSLMNDGAVVATLQARVTGCPHVDGDPPGDGELLPVEQVA